MKITFLGTGTSQGVPVIACDCMVCFSEDARDNRLRSSVLIQTETTSIVIDTGPDFRQQMLREKVDRLDAVVFTHEHKDHVAGMDDVRAFNYKQRKDMDVYATNRVQQALKREYPYVFTDLKYPGVPQVKLHTIDSENIIQIGDISLQPIEVMHYKLSVLGFRINDFVYITDANFISCKEKEKIKGCRILVINALRKKEHISHFTLKEAVSLSQEVGAIQTYLTHISHLMGTHKSVSKELPKGVQIAYDGLVLT
ncbi:MAG: MBL fold metallo-hydrolase [Flavobacteriales bacterium]|nr:MBL fold metallo-hydrolase [Flavobacteriales bacterium]